VPASVCFDKLKIIDVFLKLLTGGILSDGYTPKKELPSKLFASFSN
jgi:hypothetical protein